MDYLTTVLTLLTSVVIVLTGVVIFQTIFILHKVSKTLTHFNHALESVDILTASLTKPASGLSDLISGVKTGLKLIDAFGNWFNQHKKE